MNTYQADDKTEPVNHDDEADCIPCATGLFAKQLADNPDQGYSTCPAGKQAGNTTCEKCGIGHYSSSETDLKCVKCEIGFFQKEEGFPSCSKCIPGRYQDDTGKSECEECQQGHYDAGKTSTRDASTVCEKCESTDS